MESESTQKPQEAPETQATQKTQVILIDDDPLVRLTWELVARTRGTRLETFKDAQSFQSQMHRYEHSIPIYIDSQLPNNVRGQDFARFLHSVGFHQLYLATGYSPDTLPETLEEMPWLRGILGKDPPESL